ncbi:Uma2 family endonuclease [Alkalinema sp. FACHB-956]|uniref:Uma2 family endonuclease n=1 Tax=Alkalinema sp. FACHB-956 TaxID=2692768 RepID=UPI001689893F|nr:Uma2 family endonuclease [Alkalinema sp. FACHB-956]MBD2329981.1 Uma2 family endonuclease [Alkalinema sp. FACHB-956]
MGVTRHESNTTIMTLAEYLAYDDGTDTRYELVNGERYPMPSESDLNNLIAIVLLAEFLKFLPPMRLRRGTELVTSGTRATIRIPDLMILPDELITLLSGASRSLITLDMPPPILVIEIASPGVSNQDRDYRFKRSEYAARGIEEYWIVDPTQAKVTIFTLVAGFYEEQVFTKRDRIISPHYPDFGLTVAQLLQSGNSMGS